MTIGTQSMFYALHGATEGFERANQLLNRAVNNVNNGEIIDAVMHMKQAEFTAKSSAAVVRTADAISKAVLDILA